MNKLAPLLRQTGFVLWALVALTLYDVRGETDNFLAQVALSLPMGLWAAHLWSRIERAQRRTSIAGEHV